jgi:hypothetical protein
MYCFVQGDANVWGRLGAPVFLFFAPALLFFPLLFFDAAVRTAPWNPRRLRLLTATDPWNSLIVSGSWLNFGLWLSLPIGDSYRLLQKLRNGTVKVELAEFLQCHRERIQSSAIVATGVLDILRSIRRGKRRRNVGGSLLECKPRSLKGGLRQPQPFREDGLDIRIAHTGLNPNADESIRFSSGGNQVSDEYCIRDHCPRRSASPTAGRPNVSMHG